MLKEKLTLRFYREKFKVEESSVDGYLVEKVSNTTEWKPGTWLTRLEVDGIIMRGISIDVMQKKERRGNREEL